MKPLCSIVALPAFFFAITGCFSQAQAQQPTCLPHDELESVLLEKYEEVPVSRGVTSNGHLLEVFTNAARSTWTVVIHIPDGRSCAVSNGEHWQDALPVEPAGLDL